MAVLTLLISGGGIARHRRWLSRGREAPPHVGAGILCLAPPRSLEAGQGQAFIDAVRSRARTARPPVITVVLDLSGVQESGTGWCAVVISLNDSLRAGGMRLRLAGVSDSLLGQLAEAGVGRQIGADSIHSSVRSAVLAIYAALPGPGLVTPQMRMALARCADDVCIDTR